LTFYIKNSIISIQNEREVNEMANLFEYLIEEMNDYGYTDNDIDFIVELQFKNGRIYMVEVPVEDFETEATKINSQDCRKELIIVMIDKSYFNYEYDDYYGEYFWVYYPVIERPDVKIENFSLSE
jgi:hypothetical protein